MAEGSPIGSPIKHDVAKRQSAHKAMSLLNVNATDSQQRLENYNGGG